MLFGGVLGDAVLNKVSSPHFKQALDTGTNNIWSIIYHQKTENFEMRSQLKQY